MVAAAPAFSATLVVTAPEATAATRWLHTLAHPWLHTLAPPWLHTLVPTMAPTLNLRPAAMQEDRTIRVEWHTTLWADMVSVYPLMQPHPLCTHLQKAT